MHQPTPAPTTPPPTPDCVDPNAAFPVNASGRELLGESPNCMQPHSFTLRCTGRQGILQVNDPLDSRGRAVEMCLHLTSACGGNAPCIPSVLRVVLALFNTVSKICTSSWSCILELRAPQHADRLSPTPRSHRRRTTPAQDSPGRAHPFETRTNAPLRAATLESNSAGCGSTTAPLDAGLVTRSNSALPRGGLVEAEEHTHRPQALHRVHRAHRRRFSL
jgi:hypothetical protein